MSAGEGACDSSKVHGERDSSRVCPRHRRRLKTFCRSDHSCICSECERSDHRGHHTLTLEKHWMETKVGEGVSKRWIVVFRREMYEGSFSVGRVDSAGEASRSAGRGALGEGAGRGPLVGRGVDAERREGRPLLLQMEPSGPGQETPSHNRI